MYRHNKELILFIYVGWVDARIILVVHKASAADLLRDDRRLRPFSIQYFRH